MKRNCKQSFGLRILATTAILASCFPISFASTYSFLVRPGGTSYNSSNYSLNRRVNNEYYSVGFNAMFANQFSKNAEEQSTCKILDLIDGEGNIWRVANNAAINYTYRIALSQCGSTSDKQGSAKMTINLEDSGIEEHNNYWKVTKIAFEGINLRAEDGTLGKTSVQTPCTLSINGHIITLSDNPIAQTYECAFPEDEQWMKKLVFATDSDAAVGITKFTIYIDDTQGLDSMEANPERIQLSSTGEYFLPYPNFGNLENPFGGEYSFKLFDYNRNSVEYRIEQNSTKDGFNLSPLTTNDGSVTLLDAGQYYACYSINPLAISFPLSADDGYPFEILPTGEGMSINWAPFEKTGNNTYSCAPHPRIELTGTNNEIEVREWSNAYITGHRKGTVVYWKNLTEEEQEAFRINVQANTNRRAIRRSGASIPSGYQRLTTSGIDLTGGTGKESGAVGIVLARNGAISDPMMVEYSKGTDIPTGVTNIENEKVISVNWYTLEGISTDPDRQSSGSLLIKQSVLSSGRVLTEKGFIR